MKKRNALIPLIIVTAALALSTGTAREHETMIETLVPDKTLLFMKSSRIAKLVKSARFVVDTFLPVNYRTGFEQKLADFKKKSGIDPMNVDSLRQMGVDVDREMALVYMNEDAENNEQILIYVPVFDENRFPLTFVQFLNKMIYSENKFDLYPVITDYRDRTIYQVNVSVFATAMEGYFVIGSTGKLIRNVIDIAETGEGNLASVDEYAQFIRKFTGSYDITVYASGELFKEVFNKKVKKNLPSTPEENSRIHGRENIHYVQFKTDTSSAGRTHLQKMEPNKEFPYKHIHYIAIGADVTENEVNLNLAADLNREMVGTDDILNVFRTGAAAKALYLPDVMAYSFLSIDPAHILKMFKKYPKLSSLYMSITGKLRERYGVSFSKDIVPNINGMISIVTGETTGFGDPGRFAVYFSMDKSSRIRKLYGKVMKNVQKTDGGSESISELKLKNADGFSMSDRSNRKKYIAVDNRGFYLGSDLGLLKEALKGKEFFTVSDEVTKSLGVKNSLFMYSYAKRESYITALIMLVQMTGKQDLAGLFQKLGDISMAGEKLGSFLSMKLRVDVK